MKIDTKTKIALASLMSSTLRGIRSTLGMVNRGHFHRGGITWDLELTEGIDFAIFLMGSFEPSAIRAYRSHVGEGDVVLDIGANIGAHTLPLATLVGENGRVIAFEPTDYAFKKLIANIDLNFQLSERIIPVQAMLVGDTDQKRPESIPSRWSLDRSGAPNQHPVHLGTYEPLRGAVMTRLDDWFSQYGSYRLDFIKIDVDGHEIEVIKGAMQTLATYRPKVMMEFSPCLFAENEGGFPELLQILRELGYRCRLLSGAEVKLDNSILTRIPKLGSINVILETL